MSLFNLFLIVCFVNNTKAQINLAPGGTASQKTTLSSYVAAQAIDLPASHDFSKGCSHTTQQSGGWWKVEFDDGYLFFTNVVIYYRSGYADRMKGFSLYVTNSSAVSNPPDGILCYSDVGKGNPSLYQNINCDAVGKNVIFFNSRYTWIELCYVQTWGCRQSFWGDSCSKSCSTNCINQHCFPGNGSCVIGCDSAFCLNKICDGYAICKQGCVSGRAGQYCTKYNNIALKGTATQGDTNSAALVIDNNRNMSSCVNLSGTNPRLEVDLKVLSVVTAVYLHFSSLIIDGNSNHFIYGTNISQPWNAGKDVEIYSGVRPNIDINVSNAIIRYVNYLPPQGDTKLQLSLCEMEVIGCPAGKYGLNCENSCAGGCNGPCHPDTGICLFGCKDGWRTEYCNRGCRKGTYGKDCAYTCDGCLSEECDPIFGNCVTANKCKPGWKYSQKCDIPCDDWYFGDNCTGKCNCLTSPCTKSSGGCSEECKAGWKGLSCNNTCSQGHFGVDCSQSCDGCIFNMCERINGVCNTTGTCKSGWMFGDKCNQPCEDGYYGNNCSERCYCFDQYCNKSNGICKDGCQKGYWGITCNQQCSNGHFGVNCSQSCVGCVSDSCDRFDGVCYTTGECKSGWIYGEKCNQPCDDGYFGLNCSERCYCFEETCNKSSGICKDGCQKGFERTTCNQKCSNGHFSYGCNQSCDGCIDNDCDRFDGVCSITGRCKPGWIYEPTCSRSCDNLHFGDNCTEDCTCPEIGCNKTTGHCLTKKDSSITEDSPGSAIGGGIAAVIVLAVAVILVIIFLRNRTRRKSKQKYRESSIGKIEEKEDDHSFKTKGDSTADVYVNIQRVTSPNEINFKLSQNMDDKSISDERENEENVYNNDLADQHNAQYIIQIEDLQKVIKEKEESNSFQKEYEILPRGLVYAHVEGEKEQNKVKNRFLTTWPYDHSRVVLTGDTKHDYINASYIDNYQKEKAYIATQGPKKNTIRDFWHMIWQENVGKIVMVTKLEEERRKKCEPYWPQSTSKGLIVDNYKLTMKTEAVHTVYVYRSIEILNKTTQAKRTVHHFHFTQWPDHAVPDQIKLATFYRKVKSHQTHMKGPMVVHCSAGVGRTGTFIAVDALYENGKKTGYIHVIEYVQIMRKDRMNMIQTMEQYAAVYEVLLELFTVPDTAIPAERFSVYIQDQQKKPVPTNQSPIRLEFQKLLSLRPSYTEARYSAAKEQDNIVKNAANILAHDQYRPFLTSYGRKRNDYINAVIIPGYFPNSSFLVTHCPLKDTVVDFWTMIHDHDSNIIVLLEPCAEDAPLWCEDVLDFETLSVEEVLDNNLREDEVQIIVDHKQKDDKRTVKVFSFSEWMTHKEILPSTKSILHLLSRVAKDHQNLKGPVTVVCRDGCTRGGIFVALSLALEKMDMDSEIDIFQVVRTMQIRRPEFLLNFEQYEYCYQCLKDYFEEDSVYANIG